MENSSIIYIILSFLFGYWLSHLIMIRRILKNPQQMIDLLTKYKEAKDEFAVIKDPEKFPVEVEVIKEQDRFYLYSKLDNQFLGQGSTVEDALDNIRKRFPNKVFRGIIPKEQAEAWGLSEKH